MKAEKYLKERGEKSLKPDDYRRIGRESVALLLAGGRQRPIIRFEKRAREFLLVARLTSEEGSRSESKCPQATRGEVCSP